MRTEDRQRNALGTIAGIRVAPADIVRRSPRIGLLEGRTGVPVFLLFLHDVASPLRRELHSAGEVETAMRHSVHPEDRAAWSDLLAFFEAEGTRALVHLSPRHDNLFTSMLGVDRGLSSRTGLHALPSFRETADLVVVPQASRALDPQTHALFHDRAFEQLALDPHFFFLADVPITFDAADTRAWAHGRICPDAAVFFPWLTGPTGTYPSATVAAAAIQRSDERNGIQRLPANQPLAGFTPLRRHSPSDLAMLIEDRVTAFHQFSGRETTLWGGTTLAPRTDADARFLSTRRTLMAVREAVHLVCEPFVLEPLYQGIENAVDVALDSAFEPLRKFFASSSKQALSTQVRIERYRGEDVLAIEVTCALPYALGELSFRLGMAA